jgi:NleD-like pathogen effector protein (putative zinc metallopeptidase)
MGGDPFGPPQPGDLRNAGRTYGGPDPLQHLRFPLKMFEKEQREAARKAYEAHEEAIAGLLNRILTGQSSIRLVKGWNDPRKMGSKHDPEIDKQWDEYMRKQTIQYFDDLARTEAGFKLLSDLDASSFKTTIVPWGGEYNKTLFYREDLANAQLQRDGKPGKGGSPEIYINSALTTFKLPGEKEQPWMTDRVRWGMYHELVHAWYGTQGTIATGSHNRELNAEWQAVGLGPWANAPISENAIRRQMGKDERPDVGRHRY